MRILSRRYPIEVYILIMPSVLLLLVLFIANKFFASPVQAADLLFYLRSSVLGGQKFGLGVIVIFGFASWHIISLLLKSRRGKSNIKILAAPVGSLLFIIVLIGLPVFVLTVATELLFKNVAPSAVVDASVLMMDLDKRIFGFYPVFSIQKVFSGTWWEGLILQSYLLLFIVMGSMLAALYLFNLRLFRIFIIFFSLTYAVGLIVSWQWPALGPVSIYYEPVLAVDTPAEVRAARDLFVPSPLLINTMASLREVWVDPTGDSLAVTNFPSLHVAWGLGTGYVAFNLARPLALIIGPWLLFNIIGTVYTLQHYAVDVLGGLVLGMLGIVAAVWLINRDSEWAQSYFLIASTAKRNFLAVARYIFKTILRRLVR